MIKQFDFENGELLLINKPYGWTSFDVVISIRHSIRHFLGKKIKVGHAGTLDPLATGLLLICTGKMTKKINVFQDLIKEYTGTFTLGATTPSFDKETEVDKIFDTEHLTKEMIGLATKKFIGKINQKPPLHSAVWIKGKRAYEYARNEQRAEVKSRSVEISRFEITDIRLPEINFLVECSKGTYIRSLARDFGMELGSGAYVSELQRTRIGDYTLEDACEIVEIKEALRKL